MKQKNRVRKFSVLILLMFLAVSFPTSTPYATELNRMTVYQAQKKLKELGYMSGFLSLSGRWGQKTSRAVRKFQRDNGLNVTGKIDEETMDKLATVSTVVDDSIPKQAPDRYTHNEWHQQGESFYDANRYDEAIQAFSKAIEINPEHASAYNNRGAAWHRKGDYEKAIADFSKAIEIDPKDDRSYYDRGLAWYKKGGFDRAIADLSKAIELDPKDAGAYQIRGAAWNEKDEYDRAIIDLTKAIAMDPKEAAIHNNRGLAWYRKGEYERAISDFNRAIELEPQNNIAQFNLGVARKATAD
jgi:tetratricopeptide (TPR) repeat protein